MLACDKARIRQVLLQSWIDGVGHVGLHDESDGLPATQPAMGPEATQGGEDADQRPAPPISHQGQMCAGACLSGAPASAVAVETGVLSTVGLGDDLTAARTEFRARPFWSICSKCSTLVPPSRELMTFKTLSSTGAIPTG